MAEFKKRIYSADNLVEPYISMTDNDMWNKVTMWLINDILAYIKEDESYINESYHVVDKQCLICQDGSIKFLLASNQNLLEFPKYMVSCQITNENEKPNESCRGQCHISWDGNYVIYRVRYELVHITPTIDK